MNCQKFLEMNDIDKCIYAAELLHACQSDNDFFEEGKRIIAEAKEKGVFKGVRVHPSVQDYNTSELINHINQN